MKKILVGLTVVCVLGFGFMAKAASLTTINEASFNNIEKLAPALNTNLTNLNAEVVAATAKTASGVTKSLTVATNISAVAYGTAIVPTAVTNVFSGFDAATNVVSFTNINTTYSLTTATPTIQTTVMKFAAGVCTNAP